MIAVGLVIAACAAASVVVQVLMLRKLDALAREQFRLGNRIGRWIDRQEGRSARSEKK